jgi:hypothetical protein
MRMIDMSNDASLFRTRKQLAAEGWTLAANIFRRGKQTMLPLYEAKMIHHFDHRWATYTDSGDVRDLTEAEHRNPSFVVLPRYWVAAAEVASRLADRSMCEWLFGFRNVCRATDDRTLIDALIPLAGVGNSMPVLITGSSPWLLAASLSSLPVDYTIRQKLGGTNMNFFYVEQIPVPSPLAFAEPCAWQTNMTIGDWMECRLLELIYTAWDIASLARDLGDNGPPFIWNADRREVLRAEIDAAFFHLYGIDHDDAEYVLSTFPIANRKDPELAKRVLAAYKGIGSAIDAGEQFVSPLDPAPGHGLRHEGRV